MRGAGGEVGEEGAGAAIEEALDEMERERRDGKQPLAGDRLFHLRIAEATGNGALVRVVKMLWEERTGAALQAARAPLRLAGAVDRGDGRAPGGAEGDRGARRGGRARRDAAAPEPGVQAIHQGLGHAPVARPAATRGELAMLACRIHAKEDLRIEPVDTPEPGPGEVLLRLGAGGICGSDLHYYFEGRNGSFVVREPLIPGHEASAVVAAVGRASRASRWATRSRCRRRTPAAAANAAARAASSCARNMRFLGSASLFPHVQGMFREYFVMGERQCYPVAGDVSLGELAFAEPLAVGAARGQPRRRPARQVGADHRRRHDRLPDGAWRRGSPARAGSPSATSSTGRSRRREGRRRRRAARRPRRRRARRAAVRRLLRGVGQLRRAEDLRGGGRSAAARSCRWARCRTSRCRSSSTS